MLETVGKPRRPTLQDVAQLSGLSTATVSLALNRPPEDCPLKPQTRRRALLAAQRLGYQPNWRARALASGRTHMVGFLYARSLPFITGVNEQIMEGLVDALGRQGYTQMLIPVLSEDSSTRRLIGPDHLDGVITLFPGGSELYRLSQIHGLPTIQVNDLSVPHLPAVLANDRQGAETLTRYLLDLGHRDIAFIGAQGRWHYSVLHRREGFEAAMHAAGLGSRARSVATDAVEQSIDIILAMNPRPTALIADDHVLAVDVLHVLAGRGVEVPRQMSVAAFNDVFPVEKTLPPLTVMAVPGRAIGEAAANQLVRWMTNGERPAEERIWFEEQLVVRASTAPPSGRS